MKKVDLPRQNLSPNFIGSWVMKNPSICDELIAYFESNKNKQTEGVTANGKNIDVKNSIDILVTPKEVNLPGNEFFVSYMKELFSLYQNYVNEWPFLATFAENLQVGSFNIQRYKYGQHFQRLHTERSGLANLHRIFAWMTYLNDVEIEEGGSTYFNHYDLEIKPQKGLTLIWPADWTHSHKGNVLISGTKYIITGWLTYPT